MDFLKSCKTGVHTISGFDTILYRVFDLQSTLSEDTGNVQCATELTGQILRSLIRQHLLVAIDRARSHLWLFQKSWHDEPLVEAVIDRDELNLPGLNWNLIHHGIVASKDLVTNVRLYEGDAEVQSYIPGHASGSSAALTLLSPAELYYWFSSASTFTISFHLASSFGLLPVSTNSFIVPPRTIGTGGHASGTAQPKETLRSISIHTYLLTTGCLVVSLTSENASHLEQLGDTDSAGTHRTPTVKISPTGLSATFVTVPVSKPRERAVSSKRTRSSTTTLHSPRWKRMVTSWLSERGIMDVDANTEKWALVEVARTTSLPLHHVDQEADGADLSFLWPRKLLFTILNRHSAQHDRGLHWFDTKASERVDPLLRIQTWFATASERESARIAIQAAVEANNDASVRQDPVLLFPPSPFYARNDGPGVSGVYPTPPDVIMANSVMIAGVTDGSSSTFENIYIERHPGGPVEPAAIDAIELEPEESRVDVSPQSDGHDLFGDLDNDDDDDVAGQELSEADFSFFDTPQENDANRERPPQRSVDPDSNGLSSQPSMVDVLEQTPREVVSGAIVRRDEAVQNDLAAKNNTDPASAGTSTQEVGVAHVHETKHPSPTDVPLSPLSNLVKRDMFPADDGLQAAGGVRTRRSLYNTLAVGSVENIDRKYGPGGVFNYADLRDGSHDPTYPATLERKASFRRSLLSEDDPSAQEGAGFYTRQPMRTKQSLALMRSDIDSTEASSHDDDIAADISHGYTDWDDILHDESPRSQAKRKREHEAMDDSDLDTVSTFISTSSDYQATLNEYDDDLSIMKRVLGLLDFQPNDDGHEGCAGSASNDSTTRAHGSISGQLRSALVPTSDPMTKISLSPRTQEELLARRRVAIAQLVARQLASSTLDNVASPETVPELKGVRRGTAWKQHEIWLTSRTLLADIFPDIMSNDAAESCVLEDSASVGSSTTMSDTERETKISKLPLVRLRVRRGKSPWEMLPTAIQFWETLGLGPAQGPKNISTYCLYPQNTELADGLDGFFCSLAAVYEGCKLGTYHRGELSGPGENGLLPIQLAEDSPLNLETTFRALRETCIHLGKLLAEAKVPEQSGNGSANEEGEHVRSNTLTFVVFIVNPFETATAYTAICTRFWGLLQAYNYASRTQSPAASRPQVVLQVLPLGSLATSETLLVQRPEFLQALAREVYDRCPPARTEQHKTGLQSILAASAMELEQRAPRQIDFKISAQAPRCLIPTASNLHIGYALGSCGQWLSVAWTDASGKYQTVVCYWARGRTFLDLAMEIWQTTLGLIRDMYIIWTITITRLGCSKESELQAWSSVIKNHSHGLSAVVLLNSLNIAPSLSLVYDPAGESHDASATPASPPQGVSPSDHNVGGATPSDSVPDLSNDPDAFLDDPSDDAWFMLLDHRLPEFSTKTTYRRALASGFLVNRGIAEQAQWPNDNVPSCYAPAAIGLNLLCYWVVNDKSQGKPSLTGPVTSGDQLFTVIFNAGRDDVGDEPSGPVRPTLAEGRKRILKHVASVFRNLGMLAKYRGMKGTKGGLVPWHVAQAKNAVEGLEQGI